MGKEFGDGWHEEPGLSKMYSRWAGTNVHVAVKSGVPHRRLYEPGKHKATFRMQPSDGDNHTEVVAHFRKKRASWNFEREYEEISAKIERRDERDFQTEKEAFMHDQVRGTLDYLGKQPKSVIVK